MKMEVLSVQNQFQGQFGVLGSTKVKDWTSPLTSPLPPHHRQHHRNHHQNNRHHHSNTHYSSSNNSTPAKTAIKSNSQSIDAVDGFSPKIIDGQYNGVREFHMQQRQHQHELQQQQNYHYQHENHHQAISAAMSTSLPRSSSLSVNVDDDVENATNATGLYNLSRYNSNLICCGGSISDSSDIDVDAAAINELSMRLQSELRAAKSRHLACTEVSLPWDLTPRIAAEIIRVSEKEPCGIRGCTIYIEFEDEPSNTRRIASLKIDPNTVSTFELYLTLKHDKSGWTSLLPQFIKNLTRSSTILISPDFSLTKNKLYHSSSE